jgi:hypothetical protein
VAGAGCRDAYVPEAGGGHWAHSFQVFTVSDGRVARTLVFADPRVFATFTLPEGISQKQLRVTPMIPGGATGTPHR